MQGHAALNLVTNACPGTGGGICQNSCTYGEGDAGDMTHSRRQAGFSVATSHERCEPPACPIVSSLRCQPG